MSPPQIFNNFPKRIPHTPEHPKNNLRNTAKYSTRIWILQEGAIVFSLMLLDVPHTLSQDFHVPALSEHIPTVSTTCRKHASNVIQTRRPYCSGISNLRCWFLLLHETCFVWVKDSRCWIADLDSARQNYSMGRILGSFGRTQACFLDMIFLNLCRELQVHQTDSWGKSFVH